MKKMTWKQLAAIILAQPVELQEKEASVYGWVNGGDSILHLCNLQQSEHDGYINIFTNNVIAELPTVLKAGDNNCSEVGDLSDYTD